MFFNERIQNKNMTNEVIIADIDFRESAGACYLYLTRNGLKPSYVRELLRQSLDTAIDDLERSKDDLTT